MLDVGFNREVGEDGALYWKKDQLASVIDQAEQLDEQAIEELNQNQVNVSLKPLLGKKLLQTTRKYLKDRNAENFISSRWCRNVWC